MGIRKAAPAALAALAALAVLTLPAAGWARQETGQVLVTRVEGAITPVVADHLGAAVEAADEGGYAALVVTIDTPGGLDVSMRDIVQSFLNADVPVVAYVSPSGARAASAGTFITMAAHVAAMAPATSVGAATPVDLQGGEITDKIINDAAAFAVSVAEERGRDAGFAEDAVREGRSVTATEAVEIGAVDLIASDLADLLDQIDGRTVELAGGTTATLDTESALTDTYEMSAFRRVIGRIADPNLAFLFLSVGTLALIYEAANPGLGFAGIAGLILLVLAFFALSVLPIAAAGVALLVLAIALFVAELFVPGVGVMAAGGAVALLLSGLFLFEGSLQVSPPVLWPTAVVVGLGSALAGRAALRARLQPPTSGPSTLVGRTVTVEQDSQAFVDGAWWRVRSTAGPLEVGTPARVVAVEGLELTVEPKETGNEH